MISFDGRRIGGSGRNGREGRVLECDDIVAWFHGCDAFADGFDDAGAFVAEDDGEGAFRVFTR